MSASAVPPTSSHDPPPFPSPPAGGEQRHTPSQYSGRLWSGLSRWIQQNTFAPQWLPERLRRPLIGYVVAVLVELAAALVMVLILSLFPTFSFSPVLTLIGVVLVALGWGTGPSLLATFLGMLILDFVAIPPYFFWVIADPADAIGLAVYLLVGISIGLLAGRSQRARRQAEVAAQLLTQAEASSRIYAERLRAMLGALVATAEAMVQIRPRTLMPVPAGEAPPVSAADTVLRLVARRLAELTQQVLGCRRVSIAAVDASTGQVHPVTEVGMSPDEERLWWASWPPAQRLEERYGHEIAAMLTAGAFSPIDTRHLPESPWHTFFGPQSGRILPMQLGGELVGILVVAYDGPDSDFSADEIMLTETLARLGALVLEQDRLLRGWAEAQANELALAETKAQMDAFLGIASHELKTPLTSLKLSLQGAERRLRKLTGGENGAAAGTDAVLLQPTVEQMSRTGHQMERLERLVNDLVDVSRIQAGKLELRPELVDLAAVLREVVEMQEQAAPERTIRLQCTTDMSALIYVDVGRIEQVMTNYLTNALKYSSADKPVDVGLEIEVEPQQARVWVRDEGPGLTVEEQEHIWERFHRVKGIEVQSGTGVGLGLGLHISRMIVERHDGQVGVESVVGEGSTFWFQLPLARTTSS
jgi:signal transduction histidine kinase